MIRVINSDWYTMGPRVQRFEDHLRTYLDMPYAAAVNSGTSALDVALKIIGIRAGDEVIVPALTYIATANAVLYNQATPVFVDVDESLNLDPERLEEKITERTKAVIVVDFGGNPASYDRICRIARSHGFALVVDGAQSLGAMYHGAQCCTQGRINTTSFHMAKLISTVEGGMVFTRTKADYVKACQIRNQGETEKYVHETLGHNYRMTDIAAAMGDSQFRRFASILRKRRRYARYYQESLKNIEFPYEAPGTKNSYFLFPILVEHRDALKRHLVNHQIETRVTYPLPINRQPLYHLYSQEIFPDAERASKQILSLPIDGGLTEEQQQYVIKKVNSFTQK
jgi:perosamine synthetase